MIRPILGICAALALSAGGCATYRLEKFNGPGQASFVREYLGTTPWYCSAGPNELICYDATHPVPADRIPARPQQP